MAIVKMKKLRLMAVKDQEEKLLRELLLLGCVEVRVPEAAEAEGENAPQTTVSGDLSNLRAKRAEVVSGIDLLDKYVPPEGGLFKQKPEVNCESLLAEDKLGEALELVKKLDYFDDQIRRVNIEQGRLKSQIESLTPWAELDMPLGFSGTDTCDVILGTVPSKTELSELKAALAEAAEETELLQINQDAEQLYLVLIAVRGKREAALAALRAFGFSIASFAENDGIAAESIQRAKDSIGELEIGKEGISAMIVAEADKREELKLCAETLATKIERAEAAEKLLRTDYTLTLEGWIPAEKEGKLSELADKYSCAWETEDPAPEEYPDVPVKLKNNKFTEPLNMVTEMYSLPAYDGLDPNPLMAPFFILFFGIMMADMAYGLLMIALGAVMLLKMKPTGTMKHFAGLALLCGICTFIFGALTGGFFGDFIPQIAKIINPNSTLELPALFTPLNNTIEILIGSLILGFIQEITGMTISVIHKTKNGEFIDALFNEITWWIILAGAALAIFGIGSVAGVPVVLVIGVLMLAVGGTRNAKGFGKLSSFIGLVYNGVSGFFSDTLSYARVMALMLAGSVIAQVFNTLGGVTGNVVAFIIISLIGNALNFALNLLGCYVHDLRLQCLEYFNRFYKDGGRAFNPMSVKTKYINVVENN